MSFAELPELSFGRSSRLLSSRATIDANRSIGYVFRLKYDYDNKYLAEIYRTI
ncbi:hypothetical protein NXW00_28410 [Bacteroides thetaiotaomicron]|nr:hypothetical protein [Bacteroides thetaiotaomicron]